MPGRCASSLLADPDQLVHRAAGERNPHARPLRRNSGFPTVRRFRLPLLGHGLRLLAAKEDRADHRSGRQKDECDDDAPDNRGVPM